MNSNLTHKFIQMISGKWGGFLAHPLELVFSILMIMYGIAIIGYGELPGIVNSLTYTEDGFTPVFSLAALALGTVFIMGGGCSLFGMFLKNIRLEAVGLLLMFLGGAYYILASVVADANSLLQTTAQTLIIISFLARSIYLRGQLLIVKEAEE